jgi:ABC-2 type transport system permease protein
MTQIPGTAAGALATNATSPGTGERRRRKGTLALGWERAKVDLRELVRNSQSVGWTLAFPLLMLVLFATIFHGRVQGTEVTYSQLFVAGIIGSAAMATGFVNTAIAIAMDRDAGKLKRLAGTPMPKAAFFIGRGVAVLVMTIAEVVVLLGFGVAFYHVHLPTQPGRWFTFAWVLVLGLGASTLLGIAVGGRIGNAKAAPAVVNLPYVALQFISGVYVPFTQLSPTLKTVSAFFPLRWLCQGMRSVFLPDSFRANEVGHTWQHPTMALVLGCWVVGASLLCLLTFRWVRDDG